VFPIEGLVVVVQSDDSNRPGLASPATLVLFHLASFDARPRVTIR